MYCFHVFLDGVFCGVSWVCVDVCCVVVVLEDGRLHLSWCWLLFCEIVEWVCWKLCFLSEL